MLPSLSVQERVIWALHREALRFLASIHQAGVRLLLWLPFCVGLLIVDLDHWLIRIGGGAGDVEDAVVDGIKVALRNTRGIGSLSEAPMRSAGTSAARLRRRLRPAYFAVLWETRIIIRK